MREDQIQHRVEVWKDLQRVNNDDTFLNRWWNMSLCYDIETKVQSPQWKSRSALETQESTLVKIERPDHVIRFLWLQRSCSPGIASIRSNSQSFLLSWYHETIAWKCSKEGTWMGVLHQENAPGHCALVIHDFCTKNEMPILPQPPYSPDLAPGLF